MPRPVPDPTVLRAVAHPVRSRILAELGASGSLRAADIARELGIPANQASFHLRQLAKYGLVEEDPAAARDRRDRVWRASSPEGFTVDVGELEKQPGGAAVARVFMASRAGFAHAVVDAAYGSDRTPDTHRSTSDQALRLTKDEARALSEELSAVLESWRERAHAGEESERRTTYLAHVMVLPHPPIERAEGAN